MIWIFLLSFCSANVSAQNASTARDGLGRSVGAVKVVKGGVKITRADGEVKTAVVDDRVFEHDKIATDKSGAVMMELNGGNRIHLHPDSRLSVQEYDSSENSRRAIFNLLKGKVRNQVKQKYDGQQSRYEVVTPGVVASVRGTDFVVSEEQMDHLITRFDALEGHVVLRSRVGDKEVQIERNQSVSYSSDDMYSRDGDWDNSAAQGFFNPIKTLSDKEATALARATDLSYDPALNVKKKVDPVICKKPEGHLNQCAWHCENNPKKAKVCRLDKPKVVCVRTRCNANGDWAEETKIAVDSGARCPSQGFAVNECDY